MTLAIFGGSGKVGEELLPALIERGESLRAMRHSAPLPVEGIEVVAGSITDPAAVAATVGDAEVVLQLTKGGVGVEQVAETSVRGTVNVLDAVRDAGGVRQYLLTSSDAAVGIGAHPYPEPITHATPPVSYGDSYSLGKVLEETIVRDYDRNFSLPYTIARLSWVQQEDSILGHLAAGLDPRRPGRGPYEAYYSGAQKRRIAAGEAFVVLPVDPAGRPIARTMVQRQDVTAALLAMIGNPKAIGETFHVSGPGFAFDAAAEHLAARRDLPIERVTVPDEQPFTIDTSHTTERLGWRARYDIVGMIDAALTWRDAHGGG